jgi:predicted alpha/beta hydrolase family esterase
LIAPPPVLILPGLGNSGPEHWQTLWENELPGARRVMQRDWDQPDPESWTAALETTVASCAAPAVVVAHSLSCALVARWAAAARRRVRAGLLVAPSDVEMPDRTPPAVRGFAPLPRERLSFPAIVVASRNDPYVAFERAAGFAQSWGARFVDAGTAGHINTASGHGPWPEGRRLLRELLP